MPASFVHLHLHTEYSIHDGLVRVKPLVKAVAQLGMPACAVTDLGNLFSMVKFYQAAQAAGIKPIVGVDLWVYGETDALRPTRLVLLCQGQQGYRNLTKLVTRCYTEGQQHGMPVLYKAWLKGCSEGLIALSGGPAGDIGQALAAAKRGQAKRLADEWQRLFPERFYLEIRRTGQEGEEEYLHACLDLALEKGLPVVATNSVQFLRREDFEAHEARVCIQEGRTLDDPRRPRRFTPEQYLKSSAEMAELFADIPEALENTVEIARRCNLELTLGQYFLPDFPVRDGVSVETYLRRKAQEGLERRFERRYHAEMPEAAERRKPYQERLGQELDVIVQMGFPGYFLIVADFIQWAKDNGIPVGPGRGSGAGSLVAYALGITELDPLQYDLLFERFLNPERVSLPDFDVDFCMERRDQVIDYVAQRYGRDRVSQIITYGSMAAKAVVRDAGRVLGYPYGFVDKIAKLVPFELGMTLGKALEQEEELRRRYREEDDVHALIDLAQALEGLTRNAGKHAGGVVIAPSPLTDFMALYCEQGGTAMVTQLDKDDVEALGIVKFDFLGLRTLTIIDGAVKTLNAQRRAVGEPAIDIGALRTDDGPSYELLKRCATTAVFQLESRGMKELIRRLQPDCFEDVVALVALFRPGPLQSGMVDDFINRKHGRAQVDYPHPWLEPILKPTYGVILYQEQVMQIAQVLAGYSLGGADLLRRAMGKKKPEEMAKQRDIFTRGAVERGVDAGTASHIFDLMEKFAGYGFNKCVHGSTRIIDADTGYPTMVAGLFRQPRRFRIHALGEDGKLRIHRVTEVVWNGRQPVYGLATAQGKRIIATANHPFRTLGGWTPLEHLRPGDRIAAPRRLPVATAHSWQRHELIVLAGLLSQGNTCPPGCLSFYGNDRTRVEDFAAAVAEFPHTIARIDERADGCFEVCVNAGWDTRFGADSWAWNAGRRLDGNAVVDSDVALGHSLDHSGAWLWARNLGMLGDEATEKFIPAEVYGLRDADLELFLGRLWAGDIATSVQAVPYYATSSEMLAQGVQTLLLRLGILSGIHEFNYRDSLRPEYTVHLMDAASIETFIERVAPHALGQERRVELLCRSSTCHRQTRQETVPAPDVYWDTILSIEPLGIDDTYDLTVEGDHNFVANALFVHNSHSAAYALLAYQTAWLKTHYPAAFMAAVLSADMDNTDKVVSLIEECRQMRLKVLPPDINTSDYHFTVQGEDTILYGLGAIKGVGAAALQGVIEERGRHGRFRDLFEFCRRIDQRKINRRTLEALISAGAMDALGEGQRDGRAVLMASLPVALQMAEQHLRDHGVGQNDLFGGVSTREAEHVVRPAFVCAVQWTEEQRLAAEKDTLGLYLTGHPIARYERELARFITARLSELRPEPEQRVIAAGLVVALRTMNVRRGGRMAFISLDDRTARIEVSVFPELYQRHRELLTKDKLLVIEGMVSVDDYTGGHKLSADQIFDLDQARAAYAKGLVISLDTRRDANGIVRQLAQVLGSFREGMCQVYIDYQNAAACAQLALGPEWKVRPSEDLLQRLAEVAGRDKVEVVY